MPEKETPDPSELEEIFASIDPTPVRMAHDYLNEAGIESFVFDTASSRMLGTTAGVPVRLAEMPLETVVLGAGRCLESFDKVREMFLDRPRPTTQRRSY